MCEEEESDFIQVEGDVDGREVKKMKTKSDSCCIYQPILISKRHHHPRLLLTTRSVKVNVADQSDQSLISMLVKILQGPADNRYETMH